MSDRDCRLEGLAGADALQGGVDADTVGELHDGLDGLVAALLDDVRGAELLGQHLTVRVTGQRDDPPRAKALGRQHAGQADSTVTNHGHRAAGPNDGADRHVLASGHDVRERQQRGEHLVGVAGARDADEPAVGQRDADRLTLSAVAVGRIDAAIDARRRDPVAAVRARVVAKHERRDDQIALADLLDLGTHVLDDANELMTDRSGLEPRVAAIEPKVRAAHARQRDADHGIGGLAQAGIGPVAGLDTTGLVEDGCTHCLHSAPHRLPCEEVPPRRHPAAASPERPSVAAAVRLRSRARSGTADVSARDQRARRQSAPAGVNARSASGIHFSIRSIRCSSLG
jgi:hypothetical protein